LSRPATIEIDLSAVSSERELHATLARALAFPAWYGHNWNALWDAITGLVDMPESLCLIGWDEFSVRLPSEAQTLRDMLAEMAGQYPGFAPEVIYR
jgi:ribonuclease inhibitor